jgi:hypothetical protein
MRTTVLRGLQLPQLLFAISHFGARNSHPNDPTEHHEAAKGHTGDPAAIETKPLRITAFEIPRRDHGARNASGTSG